MDFNQGYYATSSVLHQKPLYLFLYGSLSGIHKLFIPFLIDFSHPAARSGVKTSEEESALLCQTALFDDFVLTFTDHCLTMLENSSREQIR